MSRSRARVWEGVKALLVVGIWIPLFATVPMILGGSLWKRFGFESDLPLRHMTQAAPCGLVVVAIIVATGRSRLFKPVRPSRPWVFLLFAPLMAVNVVRGPFVDASAAFFVAAAADCLLIGFWEEFAFRGLVQERLRVLGPRLGLLTTAVLFGLIHANEGALPVLIAFGIGLAFSVARDDIGMWPLVLIHATIDFMSDIFVSEWEHQFRVGAALVAIYGLFALVVLMRRRPKSPEPLPAGGPEAN